MPWHTCIQGVTLSVSPHLPSCLRQNHLLPAAAYQDSWAVVFWETSVLAFPEGALGLQIYVTTSGYAQSLFPAQVLNF